MPHITGVLSIERVIRPGAVEELLRLTPDNGTSAIIFDLDTSLHRTGLCEFIKECEAKKEPLLVEESGGIKIPASMEARFTYYKEFYGLTRWAVLEVEILKSSEKKKEEKSDEATATIKKASAEDLPPPPPKKKPKTFKKIEAKPLNIIPASIMWVATDGIKDPGTKKPAPLVPASLASRLGAQKVSIGSVGLGRPGSGLRSLGGMGGMRG